MEVFVDFVGETKVRGFGTEIASTSAFGVRLRKRRLE
jgi:hypothetical protein